MKRHVTDRGRQKMHTTFVGKQAVIIGAGIAGLSAAGALSDYFECVLVLERDSLSNQSAPRRGTSQGWHAHGLLVGGLAALNELYPGVNDDFSRAGAVSLRVNEDLREELPDREPMPQRDFGLRGFTMTRPVTESTLRTCALQRTNVSIRQNTNVLAIEADARLGRNAGGRSTAPA